MAAFTDKLDKATTELQINPNKNRFERPDIRIVQVRSRPRSLDKSLDTPPFDAKEFPGNVQIRITNTDSEIGDEWETNNFTEQSYATSSPLKQTDDKFDVDIEEPKMDKRLILILATVFLALTYEYSLLLMAQYVTNGMVSERNDTRQYKLTQDSFLFAAQPVAQILASYPVGLWVDSKGDLLPFMIGSILSLSVNFMLAFLDYNFPLYMFARIVEGIGESLSSIAALVLLARVTSGNMQLRLFGDSLAAAGVTTGNIVGQFLGTIIHEYIDSQILLYIAPFMIGLVDLCLRLFIIKREQKEKDNEMKMTANSDKPKEPWSTKDALKVYVDGQILIAVLLASLSALPQGYWYGVGFEAIYRDVGIDLWQIGIVVIAGQFFRYAGNFIVAKWAPHTGEWACCIIGTCLSGLSLLIFPLCEKLWSFGIHYVLHALGNGLAFPAMLSFIAKVVEVSHKSEYGHAYSLGSNANMFGGGIGCLIGLLLVKVMSGTATYIVSGIVLLLTSFLGFKMTNEDYKRI